MLTSKQKLHYRLLQLLFCFTAVLQVVGVASIAPFVALLSNRELIRTNPVFRWFYEFGGFSNDIAFIIAFSVVVMGVIIFSNTILAVSTWLTLMFSIGVGQEFQRAIYRNYLHQDYVFFSRMNSSELISIVTQESPRLVYNVLMPFLNLTSQLLVILLIAGGLIYLDWILALSSLLVVGGGYYLVFGMIKHRLVAHGKNIWVTNNGRLRLLTESLGGIKEVKLLGTERLYEEQIAEVNAAGLRSTTMIGLAGDLPKFVLESVAFCALLGLAIYLLSKGSDTNSTVALLSLYAMAGYKLLPAAQTIFKSASQMRANSDVVGALYPQVLAGRALGSADDVHSQAADGSDQRRIGGEIVLRDVSYRYPGAENPALSHVNLNIQENTVVALVGPSGAGKSTLADLLLGMLEPTEGEFRVGGARIDKNSVRAWQRNLGYVPQNIFILDDSVAANIGFGSPTQVDADALRRAARLASIDKFVESLPGQYNYTVGERGAMLSGGQRQRIGIARALYRDANVLIMDEATSALDGLTEKEIMATISALKATKTIVMVAHRLSTIKCADRVVFVKDGRIDDVGAFDELSARNMEFRKLVLAHAESDTAVEA